jgi:hypothetical protein
MKIIANLTSEDKLQGEIVRTKKRSFPGVFSITCLRNKKVYISSSTFDVERKVRENVVLLKRNKHRNTELQEDYILYGEDHFRVKIVKKIGRNEALRLNVNQLYARIQSYTDNYIERHKAYLPKYGYNKRKTSSRTVLKLSP